MASRDRYRWLERASCDQLCDIYERRLYGRQRRLGSREMRLRFAAADELTRRWQNPGHRRCTCSFCFEVAVQWLEAEA